MDRQGGGGSDVGGPSTGAAIDGVMDVGGQERTYRLSARTDYRLGEALPLIFVFNGVGGTGPRAQQYFQLEEGHRASFVYPTALPNDETGASIAWDFDLTGVDVPYFDALLTFLTCESRSPGWELT